MRISVVISIGIALILLSLFLSNYNNHSSVTSRSNNAHEPYHPSIAIPRYEHFEDATRPSPKCSLKLFYADWCGHCQRFKPVFDGELSDAVKKEGIPCTLEKIDCDKNSDMAKKYNIKGFPTLIFENEKNDVVEYQGERTADAIVKFLKKQLA
jgi:protein disulfide-isomerase A6